MTGDLKTLQERIGYAFRDPAYLDAGAHPRLVAPGQPRRRRQQPAPRVPRGLGPAADPDRGALRALPAGPRGRPDQAPGGPRQGRVPRRARPRDRPRPRACGWGRTRRRPAGARATRPSRTRSRPWSGAVGLDGGIESARRTVLGIYGDLGRRLAALEGRANPKGRLQEIVQPLHGNQAIRYEVVATAGADHEREYEVAVFLLDRRIGDRAGPVQEACGGGGGAGRARRPGGGPPREDDRRRRGTRSSASARRRAAAVIAETMRAHPSPVWLVVAQDLRAAEQLAEDVALLRGRARERRRAPRPSCSPSRFPTAATCARRSPPRATASRSCRACARPARARRGDRAEPAVAVFATPSSLLQPVPAIEQYAASEITLARGDPPAVPGAPREAARPWTTTARRSARRPATTPCAAASSTSTRSRRRSPTASTSSATTSRTSGRSTR